MIFQKHLSNHGSPPQNRLPNTYRHNPSTLTWPERPTTVYPSIYLSHIPRPPQPFSNYFMLHTPKVNLGPSEDTNLSYTSLCLPTLFPLPRYSPPTTSTFLNSPILFLAHSLLFHLILRYIYKHNLGFETWQFLVFFIFLFYYFIKRNKYYNVEVPFELQLLSIVLLPPRKRPLPHSCLFLQMIFYSHTHTHMHTHTCTMCCAESLQLCPTLCNPMGCSPPGDSSGKNAGVSCPSLLQEIFLT